MPEVNYPRDYGGVATDDAGRTIATKIDTIIVSDAELRHYGLLKKDGTINGNFRYTPDFRQYVPNGPYNHYSNGSSAPPYRYTITSGVSCANDFYEANQLLHAKGENPPGYTWHHLYKSGVTSKPSSYELQLVNTKIHQRTCVHLGSSRQLYPPRKKTVNYSEKLMGVVLEVDSYDAKYIDRSPPQLLIDFWESSSFSEIPNKQFIIADNVPVLSCCQLFGLGEDVGWLIRNDYLVPGTALEDEVFRFLKPFGIDCGGNIILIGQLGSEVIVAIYEHELDEVIQIVGINPKDIISELF